MRAALLEAPRSLAVRDVPEPRPAHDEVLVDVELAGVCGSDVALFDGRRAAPYPLILGHEAVGRLADDGTWVVVEPNIPCGVCGVCRRGRGNVCPDKRSLGLNRPGVFAERLAVPRAFAHPLPPGIDPLDAVGLEPLAVAVHALRVGNVSAGDSVAVIGCGFQGLLLVQLAVASQVRVLAVDVRAAPLAVAESLGADTLHIRPDTPIAPDRARSVVFEAAGSAAAVETALHIAANGGQVVVVGLATEPVSLVPLDFVRRGQSLLSSLIYDHPADFQCAIDLVRRGRVHPGMHARAIAPLADAPAALSARTEGKTVLDIAGVLHLQPASAG